MASQGRHVLKYLHIIYLVATSTIIVACSAATKDPADGSGSSESAAIAALVNEKLVRNAVAQQLEVSADEIEIVNSFSTEFTIECILNFVSRLIIHIYHFFYKRTLALRY